MNKESQLAVDKQFSKKEDEHFIDNLKFSEEGIKEFWNRYYEGENLIYSKVYKKTDDLGGIHISKWKPELNNRYKFTPQEMSHYKASIRELSKGVFKPRDIKKRFRYKITDKQDLFKRAKGYIKTILELLDVPNEEILAEHQSLYGKRWYAYFLYQPTSLFNAFNREPILGRAVVFVKMCEMSDTESDLSPTNPIHNKKYRVHTYNAGIENPMNYYGDYEIPVGVGKNIVIFDLFSKYNARRLHIKMFYDKQTKKEKNSKYMLGMYNAYEDGSILSGNILFEEIPIDIKDEVLKEDNFSIIYNPAEYSQISEEVRSFFTLSQSNLLVLPERLNQIVDLPHLERMITINQDKFSQFLEKPSPKLSVAIPETLSKSNIVGANRILTKLREDFSVKQNSTELPILNISVNEAESDSNKYRSSLSLFEDLKAIKTTRYFILFIDNGTSFDYELIKFSWALAFAKVVIVLSESGAISDKVLELLTRDKDLQESLFIPTSFDGELDEDTSNELYLYVKSIILKYLPESLASSVSE